MIYEEKRELVPLKDSRKVQEICTFSDDILVVVNFIPP